jgi:transposase InsO family protein
VAVHIRRLTTRFIKVLYPRRYVEIFYTLKEAQVLIEKWRLEYKTFRPHSSLNYHPPAPEAYLH